jgi:hypothetical protein
LRAVVVALSLAAAAPAHAAPDDIIARPLVLDRYQVEAHLVVEIDNYEGNLGRPLSLAPDAWFGIAPRWTVGIVHSYPSVDRADTGSTFCVSHIQVNTADNCTRTYVGSGLDARYLAYARGDFAIAPRARLAWHRDTDQDTGVVSPYKPSFAIGALARWQRGRIAIVTDPYVAIGLAYRAQGNADALVVPFYIAVQPLRRWALWTELAYYSRLDEGNDPVNGWNGIFAIGTTVRATCHLDVGVALGFEDLFGPQNNARENAFFLTFGWRT